MVTAALEVGAVAPGMPVARAADLLLAVRRGVVAERMGKQHFVDPAEERFARVVPDAIAVVRAAWAPVAAAADGEGAP